MVKDHQNVRQNNPNEKDENVTDNKSYLEDDYIINAEEDFRVITYSDNEELSPTKIETNKLESLKFILPYTSNEGIRYPILNDKYLEEINIYDMMPKKVQTDFDKKETKNILKLKLRQSHNQKPNKSNESSDEEYVTNNINNPENNHELVIESPDKNESEIQKESNKINFHRNVTDEDLIKTQSVEINFSNPEAIYKDINKEPSELNNNIKHNTQSNESFNLKDRSVIDNERLIKSLKKKRDDQTSKSKSSFKNMINYSNNNILTNHSNGRNKSNGKVKTIFTLMSEKIFNQISNAEKSDEKANKAKLNTYEIMINENLLHQIGEKMNNNTKRITKNFITRNVQDSKFREFKKKMHYTTNSEHILSITRPQSALSSEKPNMILSAKDNYNNKHKEKLSKTKIRQKNIRSPDKFFEDQIKWEEAKLNIIERERVMYVDKTNSLLKNKPDINKKSVDLAKRKKTKYNTFMKSNQLRKSKGKNDVNNIHCFLTKQNIGNFKNNKDIIYKNMHTSLINKKQLPETDIKNLFEKLYNEKNKQNRIRSFSNDNEIPKQSYFKMSDSSNLLILKDFLNKFFFTLQELNLVKQAQKSVNKDIYINFEEFNILLHKTNFLKFDHIFNSVNEPKKQEKENSIKNKFCLSEKILKEQEFILSRDAWKILISQNLDATNNLLNINILIIFLIAILGIYKGDDKKESHSKTNENLKTIDLNINDKSNTLLADNINNTNPNEFFEKISNDYTQININNNLCTNISHNNNFYNQKDPKNTFGITFAKSPSNQNKSNQYKDSNVFNLSQDNKPHVISYFKNDLIKLEENSIEKINKANAYLLSIVSQIKGYFPNFNHKNLVYNSNVTHQIRVIFREFYENWANKAFANKKTKRSISVENKIKQTDFTFKPKLDKSTMIHATKYRNKILNNNTRFISYNYEKIEETNSYIMTEKSKKIVTLEEIYQNIKIKKER